MQALAGLPCEPLKFGIAIKAMTAMTQTTNRSSSNVKAEQEFLFVSLIQLNQHRPLNFVATISLSAHLAARDAELIEQF